MQNAELTQHLRGLEERQAELEAHMAAIEPLLRRIESALPLPSALSLVAQRLGAIDSKLTPLVAPAVVQQHITDSAITAGQVDALHDAAPQLAEQIKDIATTIERGMTDVELRKAFDDSLFVVKQLISIMQGTRLDIVQFRETLLRFSALLEQTLRARVEDEEWHRTGIDRRTGERRRSALSGLRSEE